jgi:integrase
MSRSRHSRTSALLAAVFLGPQPWASRQAKVHFGPSFRGRPNSGELTRSLRGRERPLFAEPADAAQRDASGQGSPAAFELAKAYRRICGGLTGERGELVTPHGLRHAFASVANSCGYKRPSPQ